MRIQYTLSDIRQAYKRRSSWWGYFILHPIASVCLWGVANFTAFRPEVLCVGGFLVGLLAIPYFLAGDPHALFIGGSISLLSNLLDAMDGKLARLKNQATVLGGYLDTVFDVAKFSLYTIALVMGQYHQQGDVSILYGGLIILAILLFNYANENLLGRTRAHLPAASTIESAASFGESPLRRVCRFFTDRGVQPVPCGVEFLTLMFIVGPLLNWVMPALWIGAGCFALYSLMYTAVTLKKTQGLQVALLKDVEKRVS